MISLSNCAIVSVFFFSILSYPARAVNQSKPYEENRADEIKPKTPALVAIATSLLDAPQSDGKKLGELPVLTEVEITGRPGFTEVTKGLSDYWYPVATKTERGFVWAGNLAKAQTDVKLGTSAEPVKLLAAVVPKTPEKVSVEVTLYQKGKPPSTIRFVPPQTLRKSKFDFRLTLRDLGAKSGFADKSNFFLLRTEALVAGDASSEQVLYWNGKALRRGPQATVILDEGSGDSPNFIFPEEANGKKGVIRVVNMSRAPETGAMTAKSSDWKYQ